MSDKSQEDIDKQLLEKICKLYEISVDDLNFIIAIDWNFVFDFQKDGEEYILRGGTRHSSDQVQAELEWIIFLDSHGLNVSLPIKSLNGDYLELIEHEGDLVNAVVFNKAPGEEVHIRNPEEWNEDLWEKMGRTLGKMHGASVEYNSKDPKHKRLSAFDSEHGTAEKHLDMVKDKHIIDKFNELKEKLSRLPKENDSYGLIQYDFHASNFNIHDDKLTVYDFDDSYYFFFISDIATCIHETVWYYPDDKKVEFANRFVPALWKGYSEEFKLDRKWLKLLPEFFKWREITIYVTIVETLNDKTTPERHVTEYLEYLPEFRRLSELGTQIIPIPEDLREWFREY